MPKRWCGNIVKNWRALTIYRAEHTPDLTTPLLNGDKRLGYRMMRLITASAMRPARKCPIQAVVNKNHRCKPQRPACAVLGRGWSGLGFDSAKIQRLGTSARRTISMAGVKNWRPGDDQQVLQGDQNPNGIAGGLFSDNDRQCMDALALSSRVCRCLPKITVVGQAMAVGQGHIPIPLPGNDKIPAANHQRSPDQITAISPRPIYLSGQV